MLLGREFFGVQVASFTLYKTTTGQKGYLQTSEASILFWMEVQLHIPAVLAAVYSKSIHLALLETLRSGDRKKSKVKKDLHPTSTPPAVVPATEELLRRRQFLKSLTVWPRPHELVLLVRQT